MALPVDLPPGHIGPEKGTGSYVVDTRMTEETAEQERRERPAEYLGEGVYGLAVDLGGGVVGKYTADQNEVRAAKKILDEGGDVPGVVNVHELRQIQEGLWVIVMDKVATLDEDDKQDVRILREIVLDADDRGLQGKAALDALQVWWEDKDPYMLNGVFEEEQIMNIDPRMYSAYFNLLYNLHDIGFNFIDDIHAGNIGWDVATKELVLFDLGFALGAPTVNPRHDPREQQHAIDQPVSQPVSQRPIEVVRDESTKIIPVGRDLLREI